MADNSNTKSFSSDNVTGDREACLKYWIAAYTRPRCEKKVEKEIRALGIETYLPIQRQMRQWSDRRKLVDIAVIPMVILFNVTNEDIPEIVKHPLVVRILSNPGEKKPAIIPSDQIDKLKFILCQSDIPVEYEPIVFRVNDSVRVTRGYLMGLCGEVKSCSEALCELVIQIDILGGAKLTIPKSDLEIIK